MTREEIDAAIARHADTELLYDQPYEDPKRIRVTGPVHGREPVAAPGARDRRRAPGDRERRRQRAPRAGHFETMILDNLRKAGVQNTRKNERLSSTALEPYAGTRGSRPWASTPTPTGKTASRVAVSIGPEYGTVGPQQVKEAAKEARPGRRASTCSSSAASPSTRTSPRRRSATASLTVLATRMNPDLAMGDELLKKTGAGNLFMVFGEPDIEVTQPAGRQAAGRAPRPRCLRPDHRADPQRSPPTTSPAGSSTPTTTARASSCATPTSPAPTSLREAQARPEGRDRRGGLVQRSTRTVSRPFDPPDNGQDRREGDQPLRRRGAEGVSRVVAINTRSSGVRDGDRCCSIDGHASGRTAVSIGRDDPCPCGSGRKFKHCCLAQRDLAEARWLGGVAVSARRRVARYWRGNDEDSLFRRPVGPPELRDELVEPRIVE